MQIKKSFLHVFEPKSVIVKSLCAVSFMRDISYLDEFDIQDIFFKLIYQYLLTVFNAAM